MAPRHKAAAVETLVAVVRRLHEIPWYALSRHDAGPIQVSFAFPIATVRCVTDSLEAGAAVVIDEFAAFSRFLSSREVDSVHQLAKINFGHVHADSLPVKLLAATVVKTGVFLQAPTAVFVRSGGCRGGVQWSAGHVVLGSGTKVVFVLQIGPVVDFCYVPALALTVETLFAAGVFACFWRTAVTLFTLPRSRDPTNCGRSTVFSSFISSPGSS